eukprot:CAMPEP_0167740404 /NCGR_PEP_ID=MMETSP0110_2-20121227/258_1 /TAXON_ID=629695 /ORGANISM="Gymnochlora sp., Strain CCMP2014" /LENGTH=465 /DNA_ID=CAMNT_0007624293 /DNA_START=20 /DNA_END=1417 /DNA_ORIENTATION=-
MASNSEEATSAKASAKASPLQLLKTELKENKYIALVFYRGHWCPFCQGYLKLMNKDFAPKFKELGGKVIAVTSESTSFASKASKDWGLSFTTISDPNNELAKKYNVFITPKEQTFLKDSKTEYPTGMAQPALIVIGDNGKTQLFNWRIQPNKMNLGGAKDRPIPADVFKLVEARAKGEDDSKLTTVSVFDTSYFKNNYENLYNAVQGYYKSQTSDFAKERLQIMADDVKRGGSELAFARQEAHEALSKALKDNKHVALVFYRGHWCPFCQGYLKLVNSSFLSGFRKLGGEVIAVTSESSKLAEKAHADWGLNFTTISDPSNTLAKKFGVYITPKDKTPLRDSETEYPTGMAQPALIVLGDSGKTQLFNWRIQPSKMNLGGAKDRPLPADVLVLVRARISGEDDSKLTNVKAFDVSFFKENYKSLYNAVEGYFESQESNEAKESLKILKEDVRKGGSRIETSSRSA